MLCRLSQHSLFGVCRYLGAGGNSDVQVAVDQERVLRYGEHMDDELRNTGLRGQSVGPTLVEVKLRSIGFEAPRC